MNYSTPHRVMDGATVGGGQDPGMVPPRGGQLGKAVALTFRTRRTQHTR